MLQQVVISQLKFKRIPQKGQQSKGDVRNDHETCHQCSSNVSTWNWNNLWVHRCGIFYFSQDTNFLVFAVRVRVSLEFAVDTEDVARLVGKSAVVPVSASWKELAHLSLRLLAALEEVFLIFGVTPCAFHFQMAEKTMRAWKAGLSSNLRWLFTVHWSPGIWFWSELVLS